MQVALPIEPLVQLTDRNNLNARTATHPQCFPFTALPFPIPTPECPKTIGHAVYLCQLQCLKLRQIKTAASAC